MNDMTRRPPTLGRRGLLSAARPWMVFVMAVAWYLSAQAADIPSDLYTCGSTCSEVIPSAYIFDCPDESGHNEIVWSSAWGRSWYGPLKYVGPIEIAIQARPWPLAPETMPLYVEIRVDEWAAQCRSFTGGIVRSIYGTNSCEPDSLWTALPRRALPIPINTTYWVQLIGFLGPQGSSPFVACLRVDATPSSVMTSSWGSVKRLYR